MMKIPSGFSPTTGLPLFGGARATRQAETSWLSSDAFEKAVAADEDPYIGKPELDLCEAAGWPPQDFFSTMDDLSDALQERIQCGEPTLGEESRTDLFNDFGLDVSLIGSGTAGHAYRLTTDTGVYALKVPLPIFQPRLCDAIKNFAHLTHLQTSNAARFIAGNGEGRWMLSEFIPTTGPTAERPGKTLAAHGFRILDDIASNQVNGVYVDLDCLEKR